MAAAGVQPGEKLLGEEEEWEGGGVHGADVTLEDDEPMMIDIEVEEEEEKNYIQYQTHSSPFYGFLEDEDIQHQTPSSPFYGFGEDTIPNRMNLPDLVSDLDGSEDENKALDDTIPDPVSLEEGTKAPDSSSPFHGFGKDTVIPGRMEVLEDTSGKIEVRRKKRRGKPRGLDVKEKSLLQRQEMPQTPTNSRPTDLEKLSPKSKTKVTTTPVPNIGVGGTSYRTKLYLVEEVPTSEFSYSKIPKMTRLLQVFFHNLLQNPELKNNPNPCTVATSWSQKAAAMKTVQQLKAVWVHHFGLRLIYGQEYEGGLVDRKNIMISRDETIVKKILKVFQEWQYLEQLSRRPDMQKGRYDEGGGNRVLGVREKLFKETLHIPFNILQSNGVGEAIMSQTSIMDLEEEMTYMKQQLSPQQLGSCASYDMRQAKRDNRLAKEKVWSEKAVYKNLTEAKKRMEAQQEDRIEAMKLESRNCEEVPC
jgi:hypothetical protein